MPQTLSYRDLIWTLVVRDLKVRYRRSALGFLWTMLQPLLMTLVLWLVFSAIFKFDVENYPVYALSGILFWNFFQQSVVASMNSLRGNAAILSKVPVPLEIFPVSTVISGIINLFFALVPLFVILLVTGHPLSLQLLYLPIPIFLGAVFTLGAGFLLSPLAVFFSDVVELVGVGLMLMFYLTPVFYPVGIVAEQPFGWVVVYGPMRPLVDLFRDPIYSHEIPPLEQLGICGALALVMLAVGYHLFRRSNDRIPFYI